MLNKRPASTINRTTDTNYRALTLPARPLIFSMNHSASATLSRSAWFDELPSLNR